MFIKGMLKEELKNSLQIKKDYEKALKNLPQGSLVRKVISGHPYFYLAARQGDKVHFEYLGKLNDDEIKQYEESKHLRARYRKQISELNKQIRFLQKVSHE